MRKKLNAPPAHFFAPLLWYPGYGAALKFVINSLTCEKVTSDDLVILIATPPLKAGKSTPPVNFSTPPLRAKLQPPHLKYHNSHSAQ